MRYIYITTNTINGKMYVGQRKVPKGKTAETDSYLGSGTLLIKAIKKYGRKHFTKEIIHKCYTQSDADYLEIQEISQRGVLENKNVWYNRDAGGQYGRSEKHSQITSEYMKDLYADEYRFGEYLKTLNKTRIKKGLKPLNYTSLKEKKEYVLRTEKAKRKIKAYSKLNKSINKAIHNLKIKANKPHANRSAILATWADKDKRLSMLHEGRKKAAEERKSNGLEYWSDDSRREFSIAKLRQYNNYLGIRLYDYGAMDDKSISHCIKMLNGKTYKHVHVFYNNIDTVIKWCVGKGIDISVTEIYDMIERSRIEKNKPLYHRQLKRYCQKKINF